VLAHSSWFCGRRGEFNTALISLFGRWFVWLIESYDRSVSETIISLSYKMA